MKEKLEQKASVIKDTWRNFSKWYWSDSEHPGDIAGKFIITGFALELAIKLGYLAYTGIEQAVTYLCK